ncbi:cysteine hydrolase [Nocardia sp. NBC_00565]|uniref:isochorismatase family protein n=1 Tax=Nocardia sp. NBC_00565 TaxID=2975993 RepID=UPI002E7FF8A9|nr:isochorismatase family protein [Nocardia sp. NBC_00565]WUC02194.1 cysteine hydrolase [Nocardia sp. NBC_00565]
MAIPRVRAAVIALHWQVNVLRPEGFFGPMLAAPVAASGVVPRAVRLHAAAAERGLPVVFVRFTIPVGEGVATNLVVEQTARHATDLGFTVYPVSDCVAAASPETHAASLANLELTTAGCRTADQVLDLIGPR